VAGVAAAADVAATTGVVAATWAPSRRGGGGSRRGGGWQGGGGGGGRRDGGLAARFGGTGEERDWEERMGGDWGSQLGVPVTCPPIGGGGYFVSKPALPVRHKWACKWVVLLMQVGRAPPSDHWTP
jgi:hypothetical protein